MKRSYEKELSVLRGHLSAIGNKSIEQTRAAIQALSSGDVELAARVRAQDDDIDRLEMEIDAEAIRYLSLRAPVATELRLVLTGMTMGREIERVGDEACNIAKRVQKLAKQTPPDAALLDDIRLLADKVESMLEAVIEAFMETDSEKALKVCGSDSEVDKIHKRFAREMTQSIVENPALAPAAIELLFVAKSLERIGDHATNIAEEVVYLQRAKDIRHTSLAKGRKES